MQVKQVHHVQIQPLTRYIELFADILCTGPADIADLGRDQQPVTLGPDHLAQQGFRVPIRIGKSRVEMRDTRRAAGVEHSAALRGIGPSAKLHGAKGKSRNRLPGKCSDVCHTLRSGMASRTGKDPFPQDARLASTMNSLLLWVSKYPRRRQIRRLPRTRRLAKRKTRADKGAGHQTSNVR